MNMTFNQAIEALMNGEGIAAAWAIAQQDDGLAPGTTCEQWMVVANRAVERRCIERQLYNLDDWNHG